MSTAALIDPQTSRLFTALRALLMLAVVCIHAEKGILFALGVTGETPLARGILNVLCRHLFQTAVPLYFAISGYLLYLRYDGNLKDYPRMAARRFKTLMLPFLLVNGFWLAWLTVTGSIPGISGTTILRERGYLNMLLGIDGLPIIYPLWFLRDLFILALASPLFAFFLKRLPYAGLAGIWLCWNFMLQKGIPLEFSGAFFFYLGGLLAVKRAGLSAPRPAVIAAWAVFAATTAISSYMDLSGMVTQWKYPVWRMCVLSGVVAVWHWAMWARIGERGWLLWLSPSIFFIYLLHEPALSYLAEWTKGWVLPGSTASQLGYAAFLTAACLALTWSVGWGIRRFAPPAYSALTGGR